MRIKFINTLDYVSPLCGQEFQIGELKAVGHTIVADYPSYAISDSKWHDVSGNANDGAVTGAEVLHYEGAHSDGTDLYVDTDLQVADSLIVAGASTFAADIGAQGGNEIMTLSVGDRAWFSAESDLAQTLTFLVRNVSIH